jgi:hypothetical protein
MHHDNVPVHPSSYGYFWLNTVPNVRQSLECTAMEQLFVIPSSFIGASRRNCGNNVSKVKKPSATPLSAVS